TALLPPPPTPITLMCEERCFGKSNSKFVVVILLYFNSDYSNYFYYSVSLIILMKRSVHLLKTEVPLVNFALGRSFLVCFSSTIVSSTASKFVFSTSNSLDASTSPSTVSTSKSSKAFINKLTVVAYSGPLNSSVNSPTKCSLEYPTLTSILVMNSVN